MVQTRNMRARLQLFQQHGQLVGKKGGTKRGRGSWGKAAVRTEDRVSHNAARRPTRRRQEGVVGSVNKGTACAAIEITDSGDGSDDWTEGIVPVNASVPDSVGSSLNIGTDSDGIEFIGTDGASSESSQRRPFVKAVKNHPSNCSKCTKHDGPSIMGRRLLNRRYLDLDWCKSQGFSTKKIFTDVGLSGIVSLNYPMRPQVVYEFYTNLNVERLKDGSIVLKSRVQGKRVNIDASAVNSVVEAPNCKADKGEFNRMLYQQVLLGIKPTNAFVERAVLYTGDLPAEQRVAIFGVTHCILPKGGSNKNLNRDEEFILGNVFLGRQVNVGDIIVRRLVRQINKKRMGLPYGALICKILEKIKGFDLSSYAIGQKARPVDKALLKVSGFVELPGGTWVAKKRRSLGSERGRGVLSKDVGETSGAQDTINVDDTLGEQTNSTFPHPLLVTRGASHPCTVSGGEGNVNVSGGNSTHSGRESTPSANGGMQGEGNDTHTFDAQLHPQFTAGLRLAIRDVVRDEVTAILAKPLEDIASIQRNICHICRELEQSKGGGVPTSTTFPPI